MCNLDSALPDLEMDLHQKIEFWTSSSVSGSEVSDQQRLVDEEEEKQVERHEETTFNPFSKSDSRSVEVDRKLQSMKLELEEDNECTILSIESPTTFWLRLNRNGSDEEFYSLSRKV